MGTERLESGNAVLQTIHASEGGRALKLLQERQKRQQELQHVKEEIEKEARRRRIGPIDEKYKESSTEALERAFKQDTVGLVTAEQFREKRKKLLEQIEETSEAAKSAATLGVLKKQKHVRCRTEKSKLSFGEALSDEENSISFENSQDTKGATSSSFNNEIEQFIDRKKNFGKDPSVDTSFLFDADRDEFLRLERQKIHEEYKNEQERIKEELIEVTYSYWDGAGHRRAIQIKKGSTIGAFVSECRKTLEKEFHELRSISSDNLLYVKEDIILPPNITFYELIKNKARGKSGPLFHFDVHDDIRIQSDVRVEKDESHAGKIVDRRWYEKNKHIFPASRWEQYNRGKTYEKYTIRGNADYSISL